MAQRTRPAVHIDLVLRQAQVADRSERHDSERLVDLVEVDIVMLPADLGQKFLDGADGSGGEPGRLLRVRGVPDYARERGKVVAVGLALTHQDERGCPIRD